MALTPRQGRSVVGHAFVALALACGGSGGDHASSAFSISGAVSGPGASGVTVRLSGAATMTTTTGALGAYSFTGLASGAYSVMPSLAGYGFTPPSRDVTVAATDVAGQDFTATQIGFPVVTLTGQLAYAGTRIGPVYVRVDEGNPVGGTGLTPMASPWAAARAFTVRGVQLFGPLGSTPVSVTAFIDALGNGRYNAAVDPYATLAITPNAVSYDVGVLALVDPVASTPPAPTIQGIIPADGAAAVLFQGPRSNGGELASSYRIYWSTTSPAGPGNTLGTLTIPAGHGFGIVHPLTNGAAYSFAVEAWAGASHSTAALGGPATIGPPTGANTLSGTVTYPTPTVAPSALYVVANLDNGGGYLQRIPNPTGTSQAFAFSVPDGSYGLTAFVDLGDDGDVGPTEPGVFDTWTPRAQVTVAGGETRGGLSIAIPGGDASARLDTYDYVAPPADYSLRFQVSSGAKIPLAATATGPNLPGAIDIGLSGDDLGTLVSLFGFFGLSPAAPVVGDPYALAVTFADGSTRAFPLSVSGVVSAAPMLTSPAPNATGLSHTPLFQWIPPAPAQAGSWSYYINVSPSGPGNGWAYWMPSSQTSVTYDVDGGGPPLLGNAVYSWQVAVVDPFGNTAVGPSLTFTTGP